MLTEVCCGWYNTEPEGSTILVELIQALAYLSRSTSKCGIRSKISGNYYLINSCILQGVGHICISNVSRDTSLSISCTASFYYILLSKKKNLRMFSLAADIIAQAWKDMDPDSSFKIQQILGESNVGNGYTSLENVLKTTQKSIGEALKIIHQRERLLLLTQLGFCIAKYSPWSVDWLDSDIMTKSRQVNSKLFLVVFNN
jgi:hypothetical protein